MTIRAIPAIHRMRSGKNSTRRPSTIMIIPTHKPLILDICTSYTHKLNVLHIVILYFICQYRLNWLFKQDDSCVNSEAVSQTVTLIRGKY